MSDSPLLELPVRMVEQLKEADAFRVYRPRDRDLFNNYWAMASNKLFSVVDIHVGENVFHCHRFILSIRSPVSAAMFASEMIESQTGKVGIDDADPDVFEKLLNYFYTGPLKTIHRR